MASGSFFHDEFKDEATAREVAKEAVEENPRVVDYHIAVDAFGNARVYLYKGDLIDTNRGGA